MSVYLPQITEMIEQTSDHYKIGASVKAVDAAMEERATGIVVGHCKGIIDSVCKSILYEKNLPFKSDANSNRLAKDAFTALDVAVGVENQPKAKDAFKKMVASIAQTIENATTGVNEIRNDFCPVAHGQPYSHIPLDMHYAKFITGYVDSTIAFIHQLKVTAIEPALDLNYQLNSDFNECLDDGEKPYDLFGEIYLASEIIFHLNLKQYKELLDIYEEGGDFNE